MTPQNWDRHVNQKAYGLNGGLTDNRIIVKYKSGREIYYKGDSRNPQAPNIKFDFDDEELIDGYTEFEWFIKWGEIILKEWTEPFYFTNIIDHKTPTLYRIKNLPSWTGQKLKEVSVSFEEV